MSLAVVGITSLAGAAGHWRSGNVNLRVALTFGAVAMVGTYLGARLAIFSSGAGQLALFAVVMLAAAFLFRGPRPRRERLEATEEPHGPRMPLALIAAEGITVGILTGLVGVGGGFLIVPALVVLGKLPMKEAIAGILVGSYLVRFVSQQALQRAFAAFPVIMSTSILIQNRDVFLPDGIAGTAVSVTGDKR